MLNNLPPAGAGLPSADDLLAEAEAIAEQIRASALPDDAGGLAWQVPSQTPPEVPRELLPAGPYLYGGNAGIALFFGALSRWRPHWREVSLAALEPVRRHAAALTAGAAPAAPATPGPPLDLGGLVGLGSLIYALATLADLLDEPDLLAPARDLSLLVTEERLAASGPLDVMLGCAGTLLALLALDRAQCAHAAESTQGTPPPERGPVPQAKLESQSGRSPAPLTRLEPTQSGCSPESLVLAPMQSGPAPLALAELCAEQLLARRSGPVGERAWPVPGRGCIAGFSHGATGIAYALLSLYRRNGDARLRAAAFEGFAFERSAYSAERGNWSDLPGPGGGFLNAWCYGAPGIALGRIASLAALANAVGEPVAAPFTLADLRREIGLALDSTIGQRQTTLDHLCCGNLGRVEVLRFAAERLGDERARAAAFDLAARVLRRARTRGRLGLCRTPEDELFDPSFGKGAAGAGLAFLHLAAPAGSLPEPLLLQ